MSHGERIASVRVFRAGGSAAYQLTVDGETRLQLLKRDVISIPRPAGFMRCMHGVLWVTQEEDLRDRVLTAGEAFRFAPARAALVSALHFSQLVLYPDERIDRQP